MPKLDISEPIGVVKMENKIGPIEQIPVEHQYCE
jgi:hypothetical protein